MTNPTINEVIIAWMTENGYGGFYDEHGGCVYGCTLDDLFPCEYTEQCRAGYNGKILNEYGEWVDSIVAMKPEARE